MLKKRTSDKVLYEDSRLEKKNMKDPNPLGSAIIYIYTTEQLRRKRSRGPFNKKAAERSMLENERLLTNCKRLLVHEPDDLLANIIKKKVG